MVNSYMAVPEVTVFSMQCDVSDLAVVYERVDGETMMAMVGKCLNR